MFLFRKFTPNAWGTEINIINMSKSIVLQRAYYNKHVVDMYIVDKSLCLVKYTNLSDR